MISMLLHGVEERTRREMARRAVVHEMVCHMPTLKEYVAAVVDKLALRAWDVDRYRALRDIEDERQRRALTSTAAFVDEHMPQARAIRGADSKGPWYAARAGKFKILSIALDLAPSEGLVLEFGVFKGETLQLIAKRRPGAHGFDSFVGLPEDWRAGFAQGHFATEPPKIDGATLHVGWFEDTLPTFLGEHPGDVAFVHIDADLYGSTVTIFEHLEPRLKSGSVLLFDEYFNHPGWEADEHRAFMEFIDRSGHKFEYVAYNVAHEQVIVRLL